MWPWAILESMCHRMSMDTIMDQFLDSSCVQRHPCDYFSYKPSAPVKGAIAVWLWVGSSPGKAQFDVTWSRDRAWITRRTEDVAVAARRTLASPGSARGCVRGQAPSNRHFLALSIRLAKPSRGLPSLSRQRHTQGICPPGKGLSFEIRQPRLKSWPLTSCVILDKSLSLFESQFPYL